MGNPRSAFFDEGFGLGEDAPSGTRGEIFLMAFFFKSALVPEKQKVLARCLGGGELH